MFDAGKQPHKFVWGRTVVSAWAAVCLVDVIVQLCAATWIFSSSALLSWLLGCVTSCIALNIGAGMIAWLVLATVPSLGAYGWVLLGSNVMWKLLDQYRAATVPCGPQPTREELLESGPDGVSQEDIARVATIRDPVLRNYMITQRYHDLSVALARVIAGPNANWCTFATWASKTAGESIRDEQVRVGALDAFQVARDTLTRVRSQVAEGNRKVFAELAPAFEGFIECFDAAGEIDAAALDRFVAGLRPGPSDQEGQELLRQAFPAYAAASVEPDPRRRAEWMLLGNCLIGLHEQTRLQPNITAAMDAPVDVVVQEGMLARAMALLSPRVRCEFERLFGAAGQVTVGAARAIWQHIATAAAMHISLPNDQRIPLGRDVSLSLGKSYPPELQAPELPALRALLARFKADHASPFGLGALDWARLDRRMRFIIDLFRTTSDEVRLFEQPFGPVFRLKLEARFVAAQVDVEASIPAELWIKAPSLTSSRADEHPAERA